MNKVLLVATAIGISALAPQQAFAHVAYLDLINNPAGVVTSTVNSKTYDYGSAGLLNGNWGWADAADGNWGDSHHGAWAKFDITDNAGAYINLSVFSDGVDSTNAFGVVTRTSDFNPAFTLYSGLVPDLSHEDFSFVPFGKGGAWNALGNTFMGNEYGETNTIDYITHVRQAQNNLSNSIALNNYWLGQGTYTLVLGGDSAMAALNPDADISPRGYGISLTVTAVPVPGAVWLFGTALAGLVGFGHRKSAFAA